MKILIVAPNWIGDCLMAQPLFAILKAQTGAHLTLLAPQWVAPIARLMPEIDEVIANRFSHGQLQWGARSQLALEVAHLQFDVAYVLPNSLKSALIPWLAKIPQRFGYFGEFRWGLLTQRLANPPKKDRPLMHAHYAALAALQNLTVPAELPAPRLQVNTTLQQAAEALLRAQGLNPAQPYIALAPGAEYGRAKRWPTKHFAALATQALTDNPALQMVVLGSAKDGGLANKILAQASPEVQSRLRNLCGQTTLDVAAALIARAQQMVSNDSGLMHVTAALQTPQVAIYGSSDPRHTPPLSPKAHVVWLHLSCSPCFKRECPLGTLACLKDIAPATVLKALHETA